MSRLTRRFFVKRTGAVTLGSALGLGMLPSVTRKLHAIDLSTFTGVLARWNSVPMGPPGLNYPPDAPKAELLLEINVGATAAPNKCTLALTVSVGRKAQYMETLGGIAYLGKTEVNSYYVWICEEGVLKLSRSYTDWSKKDAAVAGGGRQIGTLRSESTSPGTYKARMFWQAPGAYGPWSNVDAQLVVERCELS